jgi:hypothetical protein
MYSLGSQTHHFEHGEQWNLQRKTRVVTKIVIIYKSMHVTKSSIYMDVSCVNNNKSRW